MFLRLNQYRIAGTAPNRYIIEESWLVPAYREAFRFVITVYEEITVHTWLPLAFNGGFSMYFTTYEAAADYLAELQTN